MKNHEKRGRIFISYHFNIPNSQASHHRACVIFFALLYLFSWNLLWKLRSSKPSFLFPLLVHTDSRLKQAFDNLFTKGLKVQENRVRRQVGR